MVCYRSFSDPFWYMADQIQFGRTYFTIYTFPMEKPSIVYNEVPILKKAEQLPMVILSTVWLYSYIAM